MSDFVYEIRIKDLKQKYFGDILSKEVIQSKPIKTSTMDNVDKKLVKEIKNGLK